MKKILAFIFFIPLFLSAQLMPENYSFEHTGLRKTEASSPKSNSILDILVVKDTVWLGTSRGLSRSTDGGASWTNYYQTSEFGTSSVTALAYFNGKIWVALGNTVDVNGAKLPEGGGLRYSSDNGNTWNVIAQPVDAKDDTAVVYGINNLRALPVTTKINNITYDIAATESAVWIASFAGGLRKSTDNGETWQRVVIPPDYLDAIHPEDSLNFSLQPVSGAFGNENNLNHRLFSVIAVSEKEIWAGSAGGINKTTDGGASWVKFNHANQSNPISGNFVTALAYDTLSNSLWAATWKAEGVTEYYGVSRTLNGGVTWDVFLTGERPHNFSFVNYSGMNHSIAATDNGIFRSPDLGDTWILPSKIIDTQTNQPLLTTVFYSSGFKSLNDNSAEIWLGSDNGLVLLKENGIAWQGEWRIFQAAEDITDATISFAFPNPFAPGLESVKIKYIIPVAQADVTIRIFNFRMQLLRTLLLNAPRVGGIDQIETWDGRDESGSIVSNGIYFYRIDVSGRDPIYGKIMTLR